MIPRINHEYSIQYVLYYLEVSFGSLRRVIRAGTNFFVTSDALNFVLHAVLFYYCVYYEIRCIRRYFKVLDLVNKARGMPCP